MSKNDLDVFWANLIKDNKKILTDKHTHGLDKVYERLLPPYQNKAMILLEIGVAEGGSLLMFEKMCAELKIDAKIYGIDIRPEPSVLHNSIAIYKTINQNDTVSLIEFAGEVGGFDIVIDDGSHFTKETKNCFDVFWGYILKGGCYVIEDWSVAVEYESPYYLVYHDRVKGMDRLVYDIVSRKNELGIKSIEIILKDKMSYALFYK